MENNIPLAVPATALGNGVCTRKRVGSSHFKSELLKSLRQGKLSLYDAFVNISRSALPKDADDRYQFLRGPQGRYIARDEADVDVYTTRVAANHIPKFKWLYKSLFNSFPQVFNKDIDLVVWGCGSGLDLLALYDQSLRQRNPALWMKVRNVTLVDVSAAALQRAEDVAHVLFPMAEVKSVRCDLLHPVEIQKMVQLRQLNVYCSRVHLISNVLDLFDDARPFSLAVKNVAKRVCKCRPYYNELIVAFSPEYRGGKVAHNMVEFRKVWSAESNEEELRVVGNEPSNCEFCAFSCITLRDDPSYTQYMNGKAQALRLLVSKCPLIEIGIDFHAIVSELSKLKVFGKKFFEVYRWAEVVRYKGVIDRFIFVADPKSDVIVGPCVVEIPGGIPKGDWRKKAASRALKDLIARRGPEAVAIAGNQEDFSVCAYCGQFFPETNKFDESFWKRKPTVDYSLYFRVDSDGVEPLPDLTTLGDVKQREVIYSRAQYRKIRGGAGCGKTTTMMWHAVHAVLRTHLPALLVCKTVTLFSRHARRMAATLLREVEGLDYVDSDLLKFMTLDKVLCERAQKDGCPAMKCSRCEGCDDKNITRQCKNFHASKNGLLRKLTEGEWRRCCEMCVSDSKKLLARKGSSYASQAAAFGSVLIDEVQSVEPDLVQAVVNLTYGGNPARECYVFCDERQSLNPHAVEEDVESGKLRVKVPDHGDGYGNWVSLNRPYRTSRDFTGILDEVASRIQSLTTSKYGASEMERRNDVVQHGMTGPFAVKRSEAPLIDVVVDAVEELQELNATSVTVICDNVDDLHKLLTSPLTEKWKSTHLLKPEHRKERILRQEFCEVPRGVQLTTITMAQGWDLSDVVFVLSSDATGQNVLENVLTAVTRATSMLRVIDRSPSGWFHELLAGSF